MTKYQEGEFQFMQVRLSSISNSGYFVSNRLILCDDVEFIHITSTTLSFCFYILITENLIGDRCYYEILTKTEVIDRYIDALSFGSP